MRRSAWTHPAYEEIASWLHARTGLTFLPDRHHDVEAGIRRVMAAQRIVGPGRFLDRLRSSTDSVDGLVDELTVGETYFFREPAQFEVVRRQILPELVRFQTPGAGVKIWSAGCASGEEAYSLAILLEQEGLAECSHILATDISRGALARARAAVYGKWSFRGEQHDLAARYFRRKGNRFALGGRHRRRITFSYLNLASDAYPAAASGTQGLNLILCRNVLIYFDVKTVRAVARRLLDCLADGGWLVTGPSDPPLWEFAPYETVITAAGVFYRRGAPVRPYAAPVPAVSASHSAAPVVPWARKDESPESQPRIAADPLTEARRAFTAGGHDRTADLTRGLESDPSACVLHVRALANLGGAAGAERAAAEATAAHPLFPEIHYLHAVLLIGLDRYEEAAAAIRRVIYLDRTLAVAHLALGSILQRCGEVEAARRAYRNALDLCASRPPGEILPLSEGESATRLAAAARSRMALLESNSGGQP